MNGWLFEAEKAISAAQSLCSGCARALTLRLSTLLLQRVGQPLADELVSLLSIREQSLFSGTITEMGAGDASIGYPDFADHASAIVPEPQTEKLVNAFLAGAHAGLPESIEARVASVLPLELRRHFSGTPGEARRDAA